MLPMCKPIRLHCPVTICLLTPAYTANLLIFADKQGVYLDSADIGEITIDILTGNSLQVPCLEVAAPKVQLILPRAMILWLIHLKSVFSRPNKCFIHTSPSSACIPVTPYTKIISVQDSWAAYGFCKSRSS